MKSISFFFIKEIFFATLIMGLYIYIFLYGYVEDFKENTVYFPEKNATKEKVDGEWQLRVALCNNETEICYGNGLYDFYNEN